LSRVPQPFAPIVRSFFWKLFLYPTPLCFISNLFCWFHPQRRRVCFASPPWKNFIQGFVFFFCLELFDFSRSPLLINPPVSSFRSADFGHSTPFLVRRFPVANFFRCFRGVNCGFRFFYGKMKVAVILAANYLFCPNVFVGLAEVASSRLWRFSVQTVGTFFLGDYLFAHPYLRDG